MKPGSMRGIGFLALTVAATACRGASGAARPVAPVTTAPQAKAPERPGSGAHAAEANPLAGNRTSSTVLLATVRDTIVDLRALARQRAWGELIDHLEDISPASRDADWRDLAEQACLGALTLAGSSGEAIALSERLLRRYPVLKESRDFMAKRADLGARAFARCFDARDWAEACADELGPFVKADPTNTELAFRLGKMISFWRHRWVALPAFAVAIQKKDDVRCSDPDVSRAVVSGLHLSKQMNGDVVSEAVHLASDLCWNALHSAVRDAMGDDSEDILRNACAFVKARERSRLF
jgi:hypothetical protein